MRPWRRRTCSWWPATVRTSLHSLAAGRRPRRTTTLPRAPSISPRRFPVHGSTTDVRLRSTRVASSTPPRPTWRSSGRASRTQVMRRYREVRGGDELAPARELPRGQQSSSPVSWIAPGTGGQRRRPHDSDCISAVGRMSPAGADEVTAGSCTRPRPAPGSRRPARGCRPRSARTRPTRAPQPNHPTNATVERSRPDRARAMATGTIRTIVGARMAKTTSSHSRCSNAGAIIVAPEEEPHHQ